jgi:quaternary ammonium compound-resistance protein SugE
VAWLILVLAGLLETVWAMGLKFSQGFTKPLPTVVTILAILASLGLLGLSLRTLPVGTAYAVWTGIGSIGTVIFGIVLLHESTNPLRLACIALILLGIVGLKLASPN